MSSLFNKFLSLRKIEYLELDQNFKILALSLDVQRFADCPNEVITGKDVRLAFPELIGIEGILLAIIQGNHESFELKGVGRSCVQGSPLYIDVFITSSPDKINIENRLVIFFEDVTEKMVLEQKLVQRSNEASLLLEAWAYSSDYLDKIIKSLENILVVTTSSKMIRTVNKTIQDLFEYSEEELVGQPISSIFTEENIWLEANQPNFLFGELWNQVRVVGHTKTGRKIAVVFLRSAICSDLENLQDFIYIGREIPKG